MSISHMAIFEYMATQQEESSLYGLRLEYNVP